MSLIYICVPSFIVYDKTSQKITERFLSDLAAVQTEYKDHTFVSVSLFGFSIIPYLDKDVDISYHGWKDKCETLMSKSDCLLVLMYPNWEQSYGVMEEIRYGREHNIPIRYRQI